MTTEAGVSSPSAPTGPGRWGLPGVLLLAATVRVLRWHAVAVMFNDGPVFLALAQAIAAGQTEQALQHPFHPLYPALVALGHLTGMGWETSGVAVSVLGGTLAVALLHGFVRRAHGPRAALVAALLLAVHPGAIEYTGDIQSEGVYLAAFLASALLLWVALQRDRLGYAVAGGTASGLAYLARPEGIGVALAVGALLGWETLRGRRSLSRGTALGAAIAAGMLLLVLPYVVFLRVELGEWTLTQKKSVTVMSGLEAPPRDGPDPVLPGVTRAGRLAEPRVQPRSRRETSAPPRPAAWERLPSAIFDVARTHLRALRYEGLALLLLGLALTGVRPVGMRGRFVGAIVGCYAAVLLALAANVGYVSGRHALPALTLLLGYEAEGVWATAGRLGRTPRMRAGTQALLLLVVTAIGLGKALRPDRVDSLAQRRAAEWLREQDIQVRGLAARKRRIAYYAGAPHVKLREGVATAHKLWAAGASHLVLDGDPRHDRKLRARVEQEAKLLHRVPEPAPGAAVYELETPPRFRSERYRRRHLRPEDATSR